jgi:hypothetical protein
LPLEPVARLLSLPEAKLQWSRDHVIAESCSIASVACAVTMLQWSRDHVIAESHHLASAGVGLAGFNGAAIM